MEEHSFPTSVNQVHYEERQYARGCDICDSTPAKYRRLHQSYLCSECAKDADYCLRKGN
jgi:hypothetical protein